MVGETPRKFVEQLVEVAVAERRLSRMEDQRKAESRPHRAWQRDG